MPVFTPSFECRARRPVRLVAAAWLGCWMLAACAPTAAVSGAAMPGTAGMNLRAGSGGSSRDMNDISDISAISAITLERDCSGCATGTRLELLRGGPALATVTGKARLRTTDSAARAALPVAEFNALARQLVAAGFFEMAPSYEDAGLQDGSWAVLSVVRGGVTRQVFRREDAGPAALKALEAALDAVQARLVFTPVAP